MFFISGIAALAMRSSVTWDWYNQLNKPFFMPPSYLFGPVWTTLYILMAIAAFLVWEKGLTNSKVETALLLFLIQLILNALWTPIFFGMHLIFIALVEIVVLWITIVVTILLFKKISSLSAILLLPYLLWVSFAMVLNASIWFLNR